MAAPGDPPAVGLATLQRMKREGEKIACLTCYDASFTRVLERAGYEVLPASPLSGRPLCCGRTYLAAGMVDEARAEMARTVAALRPALDLWRGPAYGELATEDWAAAHATRLDTARADTVEALAPQGEEQVAGADAPRVDDRAAQRRRRGAHLQG